MQKANKTEELLNMHAKKSECFFFCIDDYCLTPFLKCSFRNNERQRAEMDGDKVKPDFSVE